MRRVLALAAVAGLLSALLAGLAGCSDASERERLADDLESDFAMDREQAECVAAQVYERFGEDEIDQLRAAGSREDLPDDLLDQLRAALTPCASAGS